VRREDVEERFARASGPGGQHVNKVSSAVQLVHKPTGVSVSVQESRSQSENRRIAWERLGELLEQRKRDQEAARRQAREKKRRQHRRPSKGARKRNVEAKRRRGDLKKLRGRVGHQ